MDDHDPDLRELQRHTAQLGERYDTVRIIVTSHRDGQTWMTSYGNGNWYAQLGSVKDWLVKQDEELRKVVRDA